jgi:multiple sugar transport system substrate-binding protein
MAGVSVAALAVTGCSSSSSSGDSNGVTHVSFWQERYEDYQQVWFKKQVTDFNASHPKIHIDYQVVPGDTWQQKLKAAQAAGNQPDVATTNYGSIAPGAADGQFIPLDGLLPDSAFSDLKDNVKSFVTIGGKHYAYPILVEPSTVLYYRTDLAKAAGLDPNSPPKTWDELITWARALTKGKVKGMTIASIKEDLQWSSWGLQWDACGHWAISEDWSTSQATDPCYDKLLQFYKTLYQDKLMPQQPKVNYADSLPYQQGEVAMMADGSWAVGQLKDLAPKLISKTAVAAFPSIDGDPTKTTATLGGWTLTIDGKAKHKQQAADFINWMLAGDPQIMTSFFKAGGYSKYTVRKSVDQALLKDPQANTDPFMKIISDKVIPYGRQEPDYPTDISDALATAIEAAMKGSASIPSALGTADSKIKSVIQKQQLAGTQPQH